MTDTEWERLLLRSERHFVWLTGRLIQSGVGSRVEVNIFHLAPQEEVKILNEINCCWLWTHLSQNQTYLFCCECVRGWARAMCVLWGSKTPGCDCVAVNNLNRCESNVIKTKGSQCFAQERIISSTPLPSNNEILILCTRRLKPKMMSD